MDSIIFDEGSLTKVITRELELGLYPQYIGEEKNVINKLLRQRKFNYNPE